MSACDVRPPPPIPPSPLSLVPSSSSSSTASSSAALPVSYHSSRTRPLFKSTLLGTSTIPKSPVENYLPSPERSRQDYAPVNTSRSSPVASSASAYSASRRISSTSTKMDTVCQPSINLFEPQQGYDGEPPHSSTREQPSLPFERSARPPLPPFPSLTGYAIPNNTPSGHEAISQPSRVQAVPSRSSSSSPASRPKQLSTLKTEAYDVRPQYSPSPYHQSYLEQNNHEHPSLPLSAPPLPPTQQPAAHSDRLRSYETQPPSSLLVSHPPVDSLSSRTITSTTGSEQQQQQLYPVYNSGHRPTEQRTSYTSFKYAQNESPTNDFSQRSSPIASFEYRFHSHHPSRNNYNLYHGENGSTGYRRNDQPHTQPPSIHHSAHDLPSASVQLAQSYPLPPPQQQQQQQQQPYSHPLYSTRVSPIQNGHTATTSSYIPSETVPHSSIAPLASVSEFQGTIPSYSSTANPISNATTSSTSTVASVSKHEDGAGATQSGLENHSMRLPDFLRQRGGDLSDFVAQMSSFIWFEPPDILDKAATFSSRASPTSAYKLQSRSVPYTNYKRWLYSVLSTTQVTQSVILLALLFIYRLRKMNPCINGGSGSEYRLMTVALMLGNKFLDDNTYTNKTWSEVSNIDINDIFAVELEVLRNLRYSLLVTKDHWEDWLKILASFASYYDEAEQSTIPAPILSSPVRHRSPTRSPRDGSNNYSHGYHYSSNGMAESSISSHYQPILASPSSNAWQAPLQSSHLSSPISHKMSFESRKRSIPHDEDLDTVEPPAKRSITQAHPAPQYLPPLVLGSNNHTGNFSSSTNPNLPVRDHQYPSLNQSSLSLHFVDQQNHTDQRSQQPPLGPLSMNNISAQNPSSHSSTLTNGYHNTNRSYIPQNHTTDVQQSQARANTQTMTTLLRNSVPFIYPSNLVTSGPASNPMSAMTPTDSMPIYPSSSNSLYGHTQNTTAIMSTPSKARLHNTQNSVREIPSSPTPHGHHGFNLPTANHHGATLTSHASALYAQSTNGNTLMSGNMPVLTIPLHSSIENSAGTTTPTHPQRPVHTHAQPQAGSQPQLQHHPSLQTPISQPSSSYLQYRGSPYHQMGHFNALVNDMPPLTMPPNHNPVIHYQPLGRRNEFRTGVVPEFRRFW